MSYSHPFVLMLDDDPIAGHIFGTLKMNLDGEWISIERRCQLCNRQPINTITIEGTAIECTGLKMP